MTKLILMLMGIKLLSNKMYLRLCVVPEQIDVPVLVQPQEDRVQQSQYQHHSEERHRGVVDVVVQTRELLLLRQFRVDLHPRFPAHSNHQPHHFRVRDETIRPDRVFQLQRGSHEWIFPLFPVVIFTFVQCGSALVIDHQLLLTFIAVDLRDFTDFAFKFVKLVFLYVEDDFVVLDFVDVGVLEHVNFIARLQVGFAVELVGFYIDDSVGVAWVNSELGIECTRDRRHGLGSGALSGYLLLRMTISAGTRWLKILMMSPSCTSCERRWRNV